MPLSWGIKIYIIISEGTLKNFVRLALKQHICKVKVICAFMGCLVWAATVLAQYPYYHSITTEEGLPSNEVYSIVQDADGFIWIGCDAGLYRYNGITFKQFRNEAQNSRVLTGLTISSSGRIYSYNFNNQIFYVENDSLHEVEGLNKVITNIAADKSGQLWVSGTDGLFIYNEQANTWQHFNPNVRSARGIMVDNAGDVWFLDIAADLVGRVHKGENYFYTVHSNAASLSLAACYISAGQKGAWLLSLDKGELYELDGEVFEPVLSKGIVDALKGRKYNHLLQLSDGRLWCFSFSGVLVYNLDTDETELLYDGVSLSNAIIGQEGGTWLTSLHKGLLYIPDMRLYNWNATHGALPSSSTTKLDLYEDTLYYATSDGYIGSFNLQNDSIQNHYVGARTDVNGLYFDGARKTLFFSSASIIYGWQNGRAELIINNAPPVKSMLKAGGKVYYATSLGLHVADTIFGDKSTRKLIDTWCRDLLYVPFGQQLWAAGDDGIKVLNAYTGEIDTSLLTGTQVIAIAQNSETVFALLYTGQVVSISNGYSVNLVSTLPNEANGADLEIAENQLMIATNQGLMTYELSSQTWLKLNKISGLSSNDIKAVKLYKEQIWIATGNGLQTVPLRYSYTKPKAKVYLKILSVNGLLLNTLPPNLMLNYGDVLSFVPEAVAFSSMGKHHYAYQLFQGDTAWQLLPASTQQFSLPSIAPGPFTFQLKVIDYLGRDSGNIITLKGYMQPPFWQRWWFYLLVSATGVLLAFVGFRYRLQILRRKQQQEIERVQLQNELELSQQAALKAQMNPHFIFNVLNSIKSYIYENDRKSAGEYLGTFAKLIRRILTMSGAANVSLEEELDTLKLYIELEAMLLEPPFDYTLIVAPNIDLHGKRIPSLLIQPYIENAFQHGLRHKQGIKQLTISISHEKDNLKITIDDNGVGRKAAERLNKDRMPGHQSFASNASGKRLALLNKSQANSADVVFVDKTDIKDEPAGTAVIITIKTA